MLQLCQCLGASQAWQNLWAKAGLFASSLRANKLPQSAALELRYKSNVALKPLRPIQLGLGPLLVGRCALQRTAHNLRKADCAQGDFGPPWVLRENLSNT